LEQTQGQINNHRDVVLRNVVLVDMAKRLDAGDVNEFVAFEDDNHDHCNYHWVEEER
jgi:hypothetical protein